MSPETDAISPRHRRVDAAIARLRSAPQSAGTEAPDAAVTVLHAMYDLWEAWKKAQGLGSPAQQDEVAGQTTAGQIAAALVYARGLGTHRMIELGANPGFGRQPFGVTPFGGGWYWVPGPDPMEEHLTLRQRSVWYDEHVKYQAVLRPIEAAYPWVARAVVARA